VVVEGCALWRGNCPGRALPGAHRGHRGQELPAFFQKYFKKRIQLGLDLQGGLHLVYEVNIEKAVSSKVDRLANDVDDALGRRAPISRGAHGS
jgi:preprotein translocase subunit SecD